MKWKISTTVVSCALLVALIGPASATAANQTIEGNLTLKTTDSPDLRIEQIAGVWPPYTWDVAGNEANFFVRDVTAGSSLPFRIRPGAPTSSIDIASDGEVKLVGSLGEGVTEGSVGETEAVDSNAVLSSLGSLPLESWSFNSSPGVRHLAPLAGSFNSAFGLGSTERIAPLDVAGVSLLIGKALASKYASLAGESAALQSETTALQAKVSDLESKSRDQAAQIDNLNGALASANGSLAANATLSQQVTKLTKQVTSLRRAVRKLQRRSSGHKAGRKKHSRGH